MKEQLIRKNMKLLGISREEAIQMMKDDLEVDKMTTSKQIENDLTDEQKTNAKKARQSENRTSRKKESDKPKAKRVNAAKVELLQTFIKTAETIGGSIEILNDEREFTFYFNDTKYKIILSQPRN